MLHLEDLGDLLGGQVQTETLFNDQIWENRAWNEIPRNRDHKTLNQKIWALQMIQSIGILNGFLIPCFISKISAISRVDSRCVVAEFYERKLQPWSAQIPWSQLV